MFFFLRGAPMSRCLGREKSLGYLVYSISQYCLTCQGRAPDNHFYFSAAAHLVGQRGGNQNIGSPFKRAFIKFRSSVMLLSRSVLSLKSAHNLRQINAFRGLSYRTVDFADCSQAVFEMRHIANKVFNSRNPRDGIFKRIKRREL
jgi:hypothetical protein